MKASDILKRKEKKFTGKPDTRWDKKKKGSKILDWISNKKHGKKKVTKMTQKDRQDDDSDD